MGSLKYSEEGAGYQDAHGGRLHKWGVALIVIIYSEAQAWNVYFLDLKPESAVSWMVTA